MRESVVVIVLCVVFMLAACSGYSAYIYNDGPLTITCPSGSSVTIQDLGISLGSGESIDLGKYYTQKQLNESLDLKKAIENSLVTVSVSGTTPKPQATN